MSLIGWWKGQKNAKRLVSVFNDAAKEAFACGTLRYLLRADIADGDYKYRTSISRNRSGFAVYVLDVMGTSKKSLIEVGQMIMNYRNFVKQLLINGFDTLMIMSKEDSVGLCWDISAILRAEVLYDALLDAINPESYLDNAALYMAASRYVALVKKCKFDYRKLEAIKTEVKEKLNLNIIM